MDNCGGFISSPTVDELQTEPEDDNYDTNTFHYYDIFTEKPLTVSEESFEPKDVVVKIERRYIRNEPIEISLHCDEEKKIGSPKIPSRCDNIFPDKIETLIKVENSEESKADKITEIKGETIEEIGDDERMCDVNFKDWKTKNEEIDIKEEPLKSNEIRCDKIFPNQIDPLIKVGKIKENKAEKIEENKAEKIEENKAEKIEESKAEKIEESKAEKIYDDERMCDVNFEDWKMKNEELDIKEEPLKLNETRCDKIFPNKIETLIKVGKIKELKTKKTEESKAESIEKSDYDERMYDVNFEDWKTKNKEIDIQEEPLKSNETRCDEMFPDTIVTPKKVGKFKERKAKKIKERKAKKTEESKAKKIKERKAKRAEESKAENIEESDDDERMCDVSVEDGKMTNKEIDIEKKPLKSRNETSILASQEGSTSQKRNLRSRLKQLQTIDGPRVQCNKCDYTAIDQKMLKKHKRRLHLYDGKKLKCDQCKYQTRYKSNLKRHSLQHEDPKEVHTFKCDHCDYKTIFRESIKIHLLQHRNPDVKLLKCDRCDYRTIHKMHYRKHVIEHTDCKEAYMPKCDYCGYQTAQKSDLNRHLMRHKNPDELTKFNCDQCDYRTIYRYNLNQHLLQHKNPKVKMLKCDQCDYKTIRRMHYKKHVLQHKSPTEVSQCDRCDYQSAHKSSLKRHFLLKHKNPKKIPKRVLKCRVSKKKNNIKHKNSAEVNTSI